MSKLSTAREEKKKKDELFRYARQRCLEATARSLNSGCSLHFTGVYDRRKGGWDRRRFHSGDEAPRRRVSGDTGRRVGDLPWTRLPFAPEVVAPAATVATTPEPERLIKDRRRRVGGQRRVGPVDRRIVRTHGSKYGRTGQGRRAGDKSYLSLPWAPIVRSKPTLRERVAELPGGTVVSREKVLDLLREYGMGDH